MKDQKYIGYRWYHSKVDQSRIQTHEVMIYEITISDFGHGPYIGNEHLFSINFQGHNSSDYTDRRLGDWYAFRANEIGLNSYHTDLTFKLLPHFKHIKNGKDLYAALKKIKAKKVYYHNRHFIPDKFKDIPELYLESIKNGFELKKAA